MPPLLSEFPPPAVQGGDSVHNSGLRAGREDARRVDIQKVPRLPLRQRAASYVAGAASAATVPSGHHRIRSGPVSLPAEGPDLRALGPAVHRPMSAACPGRSCPTEFWHTRSDPLGRSRVAYREAGRHSSHPATRCSRVESAAILARRSLAYAPDRAGGTLSA